MAAHCENCLKLRTPGCNYPDSDPATDYCEGYITAFRYTIRYLTVSEYAALKRVSVRVVRAEIKKGRIPAEKIGKEYRIPVED